MAEIPTIEPVSVRAGNTIKWLRALSDYPAPTWALTYHLRNADQFYDVTASASGASHLVSVAASESAKWKPGRYAWAAVVASAGERYEIAQGEIEVLHDFAQAEAYDARSHARRALDAIEAVIERRASKIQEEYRIEDRELKYTPVADLLRLRALYRAEVRREQAAADLAAGRPGANRFVVRFGRPS